MKFKLRFYKISGCNKGNLDHEEFFATKEKMTKRFREVFVYDLYGYNPTAWELKNGDWKRVIV